jgi:hypothetical protein
MATGRDAATNATGSADPGPSTIIVGTPDLINAIPNALFFVKPSSP